MPTVKKGSQHRPHTRSTGMDQIPTASGSSVPSLPPLEFQECLPSKPAFRSETQHGCALSTGNLSPVPTPLSLLELPRLVSEVGHERAMEDSIWLEGPCLMASALGTDIPVNSARVSAGELTVEIATDGDVSPKKTAVQDKETETGKGVKQPLTGTEVVEIFAKKRHLGLLEFYHLQAVDGGPYRPYDLHVVPQSKAGAEHYVFSPTSVLHVRDGCSAGLLTLAQWHQEAVVWRALQNIPFFKDYLLRKAFTRWHGNVCKITLQRKCEVLQGLLLMAVPQFRDALFHFSSLIEELKGVHWLPQDESKTYTLLDFQNTLMKKNQECRRLLERFLHYRALILNMVQEDSYGAHQELQLRVERSHLTQRSEPLHQQLALRRGLKKELGQAEHVLQQLGNMAALVDQMIVQSLVTITRREVTCFLSNVMKRPQPQQGSLFQAELIFGADGQLTLFPPMHLFQEVVRGALLSVADSALQVFDTCSYSPDAKDYVTASNSLTSAALEHSLACTGGIYGLTGKKDSMLTGISSFSSKREPHAPSAPSMVLPTPAPMRVQGQRLRGQYYPLSTKQLEAQLRLNAGAEEVQTEQDRITQEAQLEIQQLCEGHAWLADIHLFTSQWSPASLEALRGSPTVRYQEHIQKVRFWKDRVGTVPPSFVTSNKLLIVHCSHIRERIGPLLSSVEEDVLTLLVGEVKLRSDSLILELRKAVDGLKIEPTDFNDFTHYASMVKRCGKMSDDMQQQLEYLHSLQETIRVSYRQEVGLEEQMLDLWDCFVPLLKRAAETVCQRLPSMADTLDNTFSSLAHDLEAMVSQATSGPYLDPTQNAAQMLTTLKTVCTQVYAIAARLKELSRTSKSLRGNPLDLTFVDAAKQKIEARKGLWELMTVSTAQIQEWRLLLFSKFVVSRAQEKVDEWLQQAVSLARFISSRDAVLQDALQILERFNQQLPVLAKLSSPTLKHKHWRNIFKGMGLLYAPERNQTVADLMSKKLREHQSMISKICQEAKAEADMEQGFRKLQRSWEGALFRLAKFIVTVWQEDEPQPGAARRKKPSAGLASNHQSPKQHSRDSGTFTIIGLETLLAQTEDSVMTLSNMLLSPHVAEFRQEVEHWVQLLQELEELLDFCERYQQKWVFLSKMIYETAVSVQKVELLEKFRPVDETFREMIQTTLSDPHVLNIVGLRKTPELNCRFHGHSLRVVLIEGLSTMEGISDQLLYLLDSPRGQFPRLCFLSDGEVIKLLSLHPTPSALLPLVRKCFPAVRWLEVDGDGAAPRDAATDLGGGLDLADDQMRVRGVYGSLGERVPFLRPLEPSLNPLTWLELLERQLRGAVVQLMRRCAAARRQAETSDRDPGRDGKAGNASSPDPFRFSGQSGLRGKEEGKEARGAANASPPLWGALSVYPLQCLLVAEEALWCSDVRKAYRASVPIKWSSVKARNASKLQSMCQALRDGLAGSVDKPPLSRRAMTVLQALVTLTMNHSRQISRLMEVKCDLESSFEWQSLMKYHLVSDCEGETIPTQQTDETQDQSCYVEVLGTRLLYDHEYIEPEHWMMVNTPSTDRAALGILLAVISYRCGFVSGQSASGKRKTVVQLGRALGRQVITLSCCLNTSPSVVQQMLFGALQTGAWLVLDSVDRMTQGALSVLGQHLSDIHQSLSGLRRNTQVFETYGELSPNCSSPEREAVSLGQSHGDVERVCKEDELEVSFAGKSILAKLSYGCVIISSRGYRTEVPENLRVATRPIALARPDYRIVTEVTLTSLGFSEAVSLSRCLISLFTLARDSLCLPDAISGDQTSWLVLLRKVIAASGAHLRSISRKEVTDKEKALREKPNASSPPVDVLLKLPETRGGGVEPQSSSYKQSSQSSAVVQALTEEQAIVKGVLSVLLSAIFERNKASKFRTIFEEIFPTARSFTILQQYFEEGEQNLLVNAITEELHQTGFHADTRVLHNALALYQAMKLSRAVLLLGPSGSGKTTCYRALAGALRKLAAKAAEVEFDQDGKDPEADRQPLTSNWCSVDTVVIFPNALSHEELFGGCHEQQGSWWDGAFTKVLKDSERHDFSATATSARTKKRGRTRKVKWLVMDGEPLGRPGWLDAFSTLCDPEDPFLCLTSGEKVRPSREELKLLAEVTDLGDAAPSAVTCCNLVCLTGKDLWKAVWKVEMDALYREHTLDQGTLNMWICLAEDLFSCTLTFLRHKSLTPAMDSEGDGASNGITYGLQEVMSFIRILHALLEQFGKGRGLKASRQADKKDMASVGPQPPCTDVLIPSTQQEMQARNLFLVAYVWGFGGHLHPRHWPQFDLLVREALFESRYRVEVPADGTVFDHFFNLSEGTMGDTSNAINTSRNKSPQMAYTAVQQYEKHAYLLDLMLESRQPALLVGEAGSGKTVLCQSLLSQDRPHMRLPASPGLRSADLRNVLERCQKTRLGTTATMSKQPGLLLFVEDLHEAPCDAFGKTSMALETLRQCISRGGVLTSDGYHFKLFSSGAISYLGTCSARPATCGRVSPRLSRYFSVLALPDLSGDVLFSIHSPRILHWLKEFPCMPRCADMARCVVAATLDLYRSVCERFQPNPQRPHYLFSHHDLQKVFQGMYLWAPRTSSRHPLQTRVSLRSQISCSALPGFTPAALGPVANVLNIARLWMHECLRTFGDRLCTEDEGQALVSIIARVSEGHYGSRMAVKPPAARAEDGQPPPAKTTGTSPSKTGQHKSSDQRPATPGQRENDGGAAPFKSPTKSSLSMTAAGEKDDEEEEEGRQPTSSDSTSWGSGSEEDLFGEIRSKKEEKKKKKRARKKKKAESQDTAASPHQGPAPSPPKGPKPAGQSDRRRGHKQTRQSQQAGSCDPAEPSPAKSIDPLQLLRDMHAAVLNAVYSPELCEPLASMAQQHNFKRNSSYQERDPGLLLQQLALTVKSKEEEEFDDNDGSTSSYAVHGQRVRQLVHILRALLIPGGHGALFGAAKGTGRKTTVRLAAYLAGYQLVEVHPGNEGASRDMLRDAGSQAGVHGQNVAVLVHEEVGQAVRGELLAVMANGTFPGLYSDEELKSLVQRINALVKNTRICLRDDQALEKYFKQIQRNVHVFLLLPFSPDSGEIQADRTSESLAHTTKALSLCCCVEVYQPWSSQSLVEAASYCLRENLNIPDSDSKVDRESLVASISQAMAGIHQSAWRYASILLPDLKLFSPQTYGELIGHFFYLCSHLCEQGRGQANRVATILARVKDMTDTAEQYSQEVIRIKNKLAERQQCQFQVQRAVDTERALCEQARQHCLLEETRLAHLEEQAEQAQQQADGAFKEMSPLYQTALEALESLSQSDLDEVRHYRYPPEGVVVVMDAICMLFDRPRNWESSKQLLGQSNFIQELEFFDRSMLSDGLFRQLGQVVKRAEFLPDSVRGVSRACESLCRWVRAVYHYACVQRHMAPQETRQARLGTRMAESRDRLGVARLREEEARGRLEDMVREQQCLRRDLEELAAQVRKAEAREREAAAAVRQVTCHIADWSAAAEETEMNNQTISGDALLLASTVIYLGPFVPDVRMLLLGKWRELCRSGVINIAPEDPRASLLPQPATVPSQPPKPSVYVPIPMGTELHMALARAIGQDQHLVQGMSPRLVLNLLLWGYRGPRAQRWPLLANAQEVGAQTVQISGQLRGEDTAPQAESEYGLVVGADDPDLLDKVSQGAEKGLRVLVTNAERAAPTAEFLDMLVRPADSRAPGLRRRVQMERPCHPEYCLFLSTPLPVRLLFSEIHPSILSEVQVIDLTLSAEEVRQLMLTELAQSECLELWIQHCLVETDRRTLRDKTRQEEVALMEYILQSFTPLLQDPKFLPRVSACQSACRKLQAEIALLGLELERHEPLLADLHRVAGLASALYQALQEVACLSPSYLFPLKRFLLTVRGTLVQKGRPDATCGGGEGLTGAAMAEITHRMISQLLAQYRPCLFQGHASLFRLLVSVALALHNEACSEVERAAFLRGLGDADLPAEDDASSPRNLSSPSASLPDWLPPAARAGLRRLENIPAFGGLTASLAAAPRQWREYLRFPSSTVVGPVPCRSHAHLSTLQRALLWKTALPHRLSAVAEDLAACHLGQPVRSAVAGAPHTGAPGALSRFLSKHEGPVILTLPGPGTEGTASIQPLYWLKQVAHYPADKTRRIKVKVISFGAKGQKEIILSALATAVRDGNWLVFNNCHLLDQWDDEVVSELNQLTSIAVKGHQREVEAEEGLNPAGSCAVGQVHPHFRLWFITRGYTPLSIPSAVRVSALRLVCDSPWDLKEELCSSLRRAVSAATLSAALSVSSSCGAERLLRCAVLHAVLLQRQAYRHLGQGRVYDWTQEDLLALMEVCNAKLCDDQTGALEYIAAKLVYGGHVSDSADLEAVESVARACLRTAPPLWGSGPHTLADIIHVPGRFDVAGLMQVLEQRVQALANASDPLVLGFSAGLAGELVKVHSNALNVLLLHSQRPFRMRQSSASDPIHPASLPDVGQARDRLQALKDSLGRKEDSRAMGVATVSLGPLRHFLQSEWDGLVDSVSSLLSDLNRSVGRGGRSVSPSLTLASLSRLERRAELLRAYLWDEAKCGPPNAYCLSAFNNARGFLAAVTREAAQAKQRDISNLSLHFQVMSAATSPASLPLSGVYLCGLELRGALWDTRLGALQDTLSPQPCLLPLLWVRARVRNTDPARRAPDSPPCNASSLPLYHCPLYLAGERENGEWDLADGNILTRVPLVAKLDPVLCTLRRVRLVSTL